MITRYSRTLYGFFCTAFLFALVCIFPVNASAQSDFLTVEDIKVDITADNAILAREKAFVEAQTKAFRELAERLLPESIAETYETPDSMMISTLIKDYEVTREKLSAVRYIGTYRFRFKPQETRRYFSGAGTRMPDIASNVTMPAKRPMLILPFYDDGYKTSLWSPYNIWMQAWQNADGISGTVSHVLPIGDLQDVQDINNDDPLIYDGDKLSNMLLRYGAHEAIIALASPDELFLGQAPVRAGEAGSLKIKLYRAEARRPVLLNEIFVPAQPAQTRDQVMQQAVMDVSRFLDDGRTDQDDTAVAGVSGVKDGANYQVYVPFRSLEEWAQLQETIRRVPGVDDVMLRSLSPSGADADITFQGSEEALRSALQQENLALSPPQVTQNVFGAASAPTYEIRRGTPAPQIMPSSGYEYAPPPFRNPPNRAY